MKVVLLAGGFGSRISEESLLKPKPMIEIGEMPILWHIMKLYSHYGFNEFIVCAGYKQHVIKEWFANYFLHTSDITFDFTNGNNNMIVHDRHIEPWKVTIVDTGLNTMTGGRLKRIGQYIEDDEFFMTYGDGVCDVNIKELLEYHHSHGKMATITGVRPNGRFGYLDLDNDKINSFREKSDEDTGRINAGYMVLNKKVLEYVKDDTIMFERQPMEQIADEGQMMCFKHDGFWQCMDTMKDKDTLEGLWQSKKAPWKVW